MKRLKEKRILLPLLLLPLMFLLLNSRAEALPSWAVFVEKTTDLRNVGFVRDEAFMQLKGRILPEDSPDAPDSLIVEQGTLRLCAGEKTVYESPAEWNVQDAFFDDIDHDGAGELIVICWKRGSFGPYRPSWVKEDTQDMTQHVFLLDYEAHLTRELWMSSALDITIASARTDGEGRLFLTSKEGEETRWHWVSWGLERVF